jgi:predicted RNase H-like HicB family nuclease
MANTDDSEKEIGRVQHEGGIRRDVATIGANVGHERSKRLPADLTRARLDAASKTMISPRISELVFEITEEPEGGYSAECLTESIFTQGDTWEELRANVKEAVEAYFFDGPKPQSIRLHFVRDEVLSLG